MNVDELAVEVMWIRWTVRQDKQLMRGLAQQFVRVSDGTFINMERIWVAASAGNIIKRQPNEFLKQLMRKTFKEEVRKCQEGARTATSPSTLPTTVLV